MSSFDSISFLKTVTNQPGVYRMYNTEAEVIYVGKAKDLKKRLSSYFRKKIDSEKTRALVSHIDKIDVTVTHTETEALILSTTTSSSICRNTTCCCVMTNPIRTFSSVDIAIQDCLCIEGRRNAKANILPVSDSGAVRETLHLIQKIFPVRQCEDTVYSNRTRPCLMYQIGRCAGPASVPSFPMTITLSW